MTGSKSNSVDLVDAGQDRATGESAPSRKTYRPPKLVTLDVGRRTASGAAPAPVENVTESGSYRTAS